MQITLNQDEINAALEVYVRSQINIADNQEFSIDFNAGRAPNGPTATIDIRLRTAAAPVAATNTPKRTLSAVASTPTPTPKADLEPEADEAPETDAADVEMEEAPEVDDDTAQMDTADVADAEPAAAAPSKPKATSIFSKNKAASG